MPPNKKTFFIILVTLTLAIGCGEDDAVSTVTANEAVLAPSTGTLQEVTSQPLVPSGHSVSGTVKTLKNSVSDDYTYELSNFNSQNGPDLRVYISEDIQASKAVDLGKLRSTNGNLVYSATADQLKHINPKYLLIWCKEFSVLFAYASIQP